MFVRRRPKTFYKLTENGKEKFINYLTEMENILKTLKEKSDKQNYRK